MTHGQFRRYIDHVSRSAPALPRGTRVFVTGTDELTLKTSHFVPYTSGRSPGGITEVSVRLVYRKGQGIVLEAVTGPGRYPETGLPAVLRFEDMARHSFTDEMGLDLLLD